MSESARSWGLAGTVEEASRVLVALRLLRAGGPHGSGFLPALLGREGLRGGDATPNTQTQRRLREVGSLFPYSQCPT